MRKLDEQEIKIIKELIRNPRTSDNQISKKTKVPVMSVNRKRKRLEEEGILNYHTVVSRGDPKKKSFRARQLYTIQFKIGVTQEMYIEALRNDKQVKEENAKHHVNSYLGEKDGHLTLIVMLEAENHDKLLAVFNGKIIPNIKKRFGEDCIKKIYTVRLYRPVRVHNNYLPLFNMEKGVIRENWPDEYIFVQ